MVEELANGFLKQSEKPLTRFIEETDAAVSAAEELYTLLRPYFAEHSCTRSWRPYLHEQSITRYPSDDILDVLGNSVSMGKMMAQMALNPASKRDELKQKRYLGIISKSVLGQVDKARFENETLSEHLKWAGEELKIILEERSDIPKKIQEQSEQKLEALFKSVRQLEEIGLKLKDILNIPAKSSRGL